MLALIRTEGKVFAGVPALTPETFLELPDLQRASKTDDTREVEEAFGLGDCLYFFAGHACHSFGDIVLVYDAEMADADEGGATPFDTGGLYSNRIHYTSDGGDKASYCRDHRCSLDHWHANAQAYVQEHFLSHEAYVLGERPLRDDPTKRLMDLRNERRAWTWEIRLHRDHPMEHSLRGVWMAEEYYDRVVELTEHPGVSERGTALVMSDKVHSSSMELLHEAAEKAAATWT